ncbi:MAG: 30S ribosome-binding factor RbfA [Spirochaetales bacterium]|nr:30S ribosome-binding factor RbfA [Spirochaetales bacterium]
MSDIRIRRVESLLRDEISLLILKNKIKDPRVGSFLSVNRVKASKDLSSAKIFVSTYESEKKHQLGVDGLNNAAGFIQREVGRKLKTRTTPKLNFIMDTSIRDGFEVNKKIEELNSGE